MEAAAPPIELYNTSGIEIPVNRAEAAYLQQVISDDLNCAFSFVEVVFVDEDEIVRINKEYLQRDYITDIISFRYDEDDSDQHIEGTLYCCAQRIAEQAKEFSDSVELEFQRIIAHGLIHLVGYDDQTPEEKAAMTRLENNYLRALSSR